MSDAQIVIHIGVDGSVRAETVGIKGPRCLESIELLEAMLDAETASSTFTHEYADTTTRHTHEARNDLSQ